MSQTTLPLDDWTGRTIEHPSADGLMLTVVAYCPAGQWTEIEGHPAIDRTRYLEDTLMCKAVEGHGWYSIAVENLR